MSQYDRWYPFIRFMVTMMVMLVVVSTVYQGNRNSVSQEISEEATIIEEETQPTNETEAEKEIAEAKIINDEDNQWSEYENGFYVAEQLWQLRKDIMSKKQIEDFEYINATLVNAATEKKEEEFLTAIDSMNKFIKQTVGEKSCIDIKRNFDFDGFLDGDFLYLNLDILEVAIGNEEENVSKNSVYNTSKSKIDETKSTTLNHKTVNELISYIQQETKNVQQSRA